jgi:molecular chaperone HtpG
MDSGADSGAATFAFQAEIKQLLGLMVHSLYSDREIFLRELVSNASDANDRLRFEALARPELAAFGELEIRVSVDSEKRLLSITDNGIGMSRDEVIEHLGTIARSGTGQFLERLKDDQRKDAQLIGQFGVGFYSAFIVADEVAVLSRRADAPPEQGVRWVSDGQGEYSVANVTRTERGTTVELKLKADAAEFLQPYRLRELIRKYSDHIAFPVRMPAEGDAATLETVNRAKALWSRPRTEIKDDEYVEFYKHIAHDSEDPLTWSHNRVEGKREYTSLLYVPSVAPFDLWNRESPKGVKLYVQRVFITDQATQFLPLYLRFIRGVVDSGELSLNVSRELLQQDAAIAAMRTALTRRALDMLERLAEESADKYATFWKEFGALMKEGVVEDTANRDKLAKLLRFNTTRSAGADQDRSLASYLADLRPEQKAIYFLVAESPTAARSSPHLETFRERGIEVLLLSDRLDEWVMQHFTEHQGKPFKDVRRGVLDPTELGGEKPAEADKDNKALLKRVKRALRDRVEEVRVGGRLKQSAACLVLSEHDLGYQMRELLAAAGHKPPPSTPSLELNLEHALVRKLDAETDDARFDRLALLLFEQAVLAEGRQLEDPAAFVTRLNELLAELSPPQ